MFGLVIIRVFYFGFAWWVWNLFGDLVGWGERHFEFVVLFCVDLLK